MFKTSKLAKGILYASSALVSLSLPGVVSAQDAPAADEASGESGDIIVTARKRAEDIQTVPITITAYTDADLEERNISNIADLGNSTPGMAVTSITGGTVLGIYLRGLAPANTANDLNVDANVGVFIDGMYQTSRNTLDIISVLDVGQIEVVKGPQSALYGRSTFAGALNVSTKRPSQEWEGSVQATVGQDEDYRIRGTVGGPITDYLSFRVAGGYLTYDGYGKNLANTKDNLGGTQKYAFSGALELRPSENFTMRLSGFLSHSETELSPTTTLPLSAFNCGTTNTSAVANGLRQLYCGPQPINSLSSLTPNALDTVAKNRQFTFDVEWDLGFGTFISTTGSTHSTNETYNDYDGTAAGVLVGVCTVPASCFAGAYTRLTNVNALSISRERVNSFSQEFRLQSNEGSDLSWLVGVSAYHARVPLAAGGIGVSATSPLAAGERIIAVTQIATPPAAGTGAFEFTANPFLVADSTVTQLSSSYSDSRTNSRSVFGALGYKFGNLRVNAEGRYNVDRKRAQVFAVAANPTSAPGINREIIGTKTPTTGFTGGTIYRRKFSSFAPRFTVDWQATPDILLYASAAKGVRNGGFNTANPANGSPTGILPSEASYDEETNWTYEAGVKSNLFDNRLLLNASVFHIDWTNAQVSGFTQNPAATTVNRIVLNIGDIKSTGFEALAELKITDMFSVGGNFSYSDPKFQSGSYDGGQVTTCVIPGATPAAATAAPGCPPVIVVTRANGTQAAVPSIEGRRPQRSVKTQWNIHAKADVPISDDWNATARVDVNYTGPAFNNLINTQFFGKRTLTNVRLGAQNDQFSVSLWANNVFNKKYVQNGINQPRIGAPFAFSVPEIYLGETRRMGVTATAKF